MRSDEIMTALAEMLEEFGEVSPDDVVADAAFVDDLGLDSLAMVEVVVASESRFDVKISEEDIRSLRTVGDFVAYVEKARQWASPTK
jgi:acyl carrier protein